MSVTVEQQGAVCRVAILGKLEAPQNKVELLSVLQGGAETDPGGNEGTLELTFYDADTLPADVVQALDVRQQRDAGLKIVAYHALLCHALMRLNLPVRQMMQPVNRVEPPVCKALALAGSAQSLDKILQVMEHLPPAQAAIFVVQHVREDQPNLLDQLLKTRTQYQVVMPQNLMPVQAGTLYVAPPGHHMRVAHGLVYLTCDAKVQFARPSIDVLFASLAAEYGPVAMVALLCGYGQDGVDGCAALRAAGATVLVEDGGECAPARAMPDAARDAGHCDYVMKCAAIASVAAATVAGEKTPPAGVFLELFLQAILQQYGYDFRGYQRDSLERRFKNLMMSFGGLGFAQFQREVLSDTAQFERLCAELSVGVTQFFRHPEQMGVLRDEVLPYLASFPVVKLWSAGCSTGEEAYSLAIVLDELGMLERSHLFATDINPYLLEQAMGGLFPCAPMEKNRENYRASGGVHTFDGNFSVGKNLFTASARLRQQILFHRHSLVGDGVFNEFQLIVCRNVLIYFNVELQRRVLQVFARSLHTDGFLVLGPQDGLNWVALEQGFVPYQPNSHIYRLKAGAS